MKSTKKKNPTFEFDPIEYMRDTQHLSANARVIYDKIMCEHVNHLWISYDFHMILIRYSSDLERAELAQVIEQTELGFRIPWVAESVQKTRDYRASRSNKKSGRPPKKISVNNEKSEQEKESYDFHMISDDSDATSIYIEIDKNKELIEGIRGKEEKKEKRKKVSPPFSPPSPMEVEAYFGTLGLNGQSAIQAEKFMNHYESNGWKVGRNPMKSWQAACRNWKSNIKEFSNGYITTTTSNTAPPKLGTSEARMQALEQWGNSGSRTLFSEDLDELRR